MIYDSLKNSNNYMMNPYFEKAWEFLRTSEGLACGKYELGGGMYANVMEFTSKPLAETQIEAHNNYIDIQYIASGEETMGFSTDYEHIIKDYDDKADIYFVEAKCDYITLKQGEFAVFFPTDYHRPSIGEGGTVRKIVVKVPF